ncbi:hypothetical protein MHU86_20488 [Fragilaria crotonensis]|nr:hypothetical protein MHU86_20488 [Fragilaria crotonensis]
MSQGFMLPIIRRETVDDQPLLVLCATSPTSPLAPRTLLPPTPQSEIVTTPDTIVRKLRQRFQNHLVRGHACEEFLQSKGVGNAWKSLVHVHGLQDPIALAFHGDENKATESEERASYWLIFCKCGSWAEIGQALKKDERICSKCRNDKRKMARRQIQIDKKTQLAHPSSRAPYSSLATPVKVERYKNVRKLVHAEKRRNARLEDVLSKNHAKTLNNSDESANELVSAASQFFAENSDDMVNLIKNIVLAKCGSKKSECEVTEFAEHCVSAIKNFTKIGNGQEKQVRFTPLTLRAALSLWMRCKKGYAIHRMLSVDIMPSQSLLKGILKGNRVNEGKCAKLYGWFSDHHVSERNVCIDAHLMHDELKLVNDVYWNCSNNHMVGLAASVGEFNQLLPEIEVANLFLAATNAIDKDIDTQPETHETNQVINTNRRQQDAMDLWLTYKPAMYVNLWRLRTTKNVSYNCEFFYNNGSLTGDELLRQFLRVAGHCELIGVHILGLLNDAAGQNVKLVDLLTSADTKIAVTGYPLIENVTFANHINPSQSVAVYHCSSHNLKASRNQLLRSHPNGSRLLKMHEAHFGWTEIEECYNRDVLRQPQISKLRKASIEVDSYSSMCVSYAKAPSARETLLEQCLFLAEALMCDRQLKDLDLRNAQEVYENAIPLFRSKLTPQTAYHIRSCLNTLEYTSVVGAIFNDFFLNSKVMITRDNIDAYETTMKTFVGNFYDRWYDSIDPSETRKNRLKHFISSITYKNLRLSMRGFFEYCRLALFKSSNPPEFVLVSHSNSSSIESVFSLARSQKRDTPQGFCTSIAVQSSTEAIAVVKTFDKPAYSSEDIPDVDVRNTFDLLSRRDAERNQIFSDFLKARNEINANAATTSYQVENIFEGIDSSCLSPGYRRLHDILVGNAKQRLGMKGFLGLLLGTKGLCCHGKGFNLYCQRELVQIAVQPGRRRRNELQLSLFMHPVNTFSELIRSICFQSEACSLFHHRLYKMMKERNHVAWKIVIDKLPTCLRLKDAPVCLLIQCLSDILLEWVYDAMSARLSEKKIEREAIASSRQSNATNTVDNSQDVIMSQVQRFFGWSIFSLKRKLENEQCDNKDGLDLLEKMSVFHHEVINDELYMKNCYPIANEVMNKGGLTLVATNFIGFGRSLMTMVKKLTIETVLQKGNRAIEDLVSDVLHSEKLKRIFWSCCETSYSNERRENTSTNTLQSLYTALTKKNNPCMGRHDFPEIQRTLYGKTGKEHDQVTITC